MKLRPPQLAASSLFARPAMSAYSEHGIRVGRCLFTRRCGTLRRSPCSSCHKFGRVTWSAYPDFVDVKINCIGGDRVELCFSPTVNYLSAATPACHPAIQCCRSRRSHRLPPPRVKMVSNDGSHVQVTEARGLSWQRRLARWPQTF